MDWLLVKEHKAEGRNTVGYKEGNSYSGGKSGAGSPKDLDCDWCFLT